MNFLDFILIASSIVIFRRISSSGTTYFVILFICVITGIGLATLTAPLLSQKIESSFIIGLIQYAIYFLFVAIIIKLILPSAKRIKYHVMAGRGFKIDQHTFIPVYILGIIILLPLISLITAYIPIVHNQFQSQGSTVLRLSNKYSYDLSESTFKKLSPDQFQNLKIDYYEAPLTYETINGFTPYEEVAKSVAPSVVKIVGSGCALTNYFQASGSGFVAGDGFIITNAHVVISQSMAFVRTHEGTYPATVMALDQDLDLAVIYSRYIDLPGLELNINEDEVLSTKDGFTLGYPGGLDLKANKAKILPKNEYISWINNSKYGTDVYFQVEDASAPGNSGSPSFLNNGKVYGVVSNISSGRTGIVKAKYAEQLLEKAKSSMFSKSSGACEIFDGFKR